MESRMMIRVNEKRASNFTRYLTLRIKNEIIMTIQNLEFMCDKFYCGK
jgi:hypothetical protein